MADKNVLTAAQAEKAAELIRDEWPDSMLNNEFKPMLDGLDTIASGSHAVYDKATHVAVPREPTKDMIWAAHHANPRATRLHEIYAAMLAAALQDEEKKDGR